MTDVPGYQLDRLIGRGASGEVWLGRQRAAGGRTVAIKCLATPDAASSRERLRVEGRVLASLEHPHIVTLYDVVERSGGVALIMQYAAGGSLAALLGQRRLTAGQVVTVAAPLADALGYAHGRGTVHGDVTPANVLFTDDGRPLLADFGIARVAARLSARSGLVGTPHYLDPQVALGAPPDPASDIYALGAICYEALTGRPPYIGSTPFELLQRAREGERPALADLAPDAPAALVAAIDRALHPDPAARYADAAAFAVDLRAAATPESVPMLPRDVPVAVAAPARATREFGPRPPRRPAEHADGGIWERLYAAAGDRRMRLGAVGALVALALASVGVLVSGAGESSAGNAPAGATARTPAATPSVRAAAAAASPSVRPSARPTAPTTSPPVSAPPVGPIAPRVPSPAASPATPAQWRAVLAWLDDRRARAYETADVALLDSVYVDGPDHRKDRARVAKLAADKHRVVGLRINYRDVRILTAGASTATLDVIDELPAYRHVDAKGVLIKPFPGRGLKRWVITLKRTSGEWRVASIAGIAGSG